MTTSEQAELNPSEPSTPLTLVEPKLWAGKYKTPEELEEGYNKIRATHNENVELKKKLEVPEDYQVPTDLALRQAEILDLKAIAKNAGLNQEQFVKTAKEMQARIQHQLTSFEQAKQNVGEANLNILTDYVTKLYPESLRETILNKLIKDKDAMTDALKHRESLLNNTAPGMDVGEGGKKEKYNGQKELAEAAKAYHKNPKDKVAKQRYIDIASQVGNERFGNK